MTRLLALAREPWSPAFIYAVLFGSGVVLWLLACNGGCRI